MSGRIKFEFDKELAYQQDAINAAVSLLQGLPKNAPSSVYLHKNQNVRNEPKRNIDIIMGESRLLKNLNAIQIKNDLYPDSELHNNNFTIEMETGTGKTYVYISTILKLHQEHGINKFIIVVPSIAIRMGVYKSITMLREHFHGIYNIDIIKSAFIYEGNLGELQSSLVESDNLSICIMNSQSFNKKDTNRVRTPTERGDIIWDEIKWVRPVVIIDEPQKFEGGGKKKSASMQAIDELNPMLILRYSATHKNLYNLIYQLDSFAAYNNNLVKKIEVKTVHGVVPKDYPYIGYIGMTDDLKARIEMFAQTQGKGVRSVTVSVKGGDSLYDLSGGLVQYQNMRIEADPRRDSPLKIKDSENQSIEIPMGLSSYTAVRSDAARIQIRLAIRSHFDKQFKLLASGKEIKALTLFFIDSVDKVRNSSQKDGRGEYLRIFDEEYAAVIPEYKGKFEQYAAKFPGYKNIQSVREGYFAVDKKKNPVEVDESRIVAKTQEDIDRAIELILEKKDELISFTEPLAFIFSHSALREGWDNPNVFTICTLKQSSNDMAKKQEIGRGLRLPVDIHGRRHTDSELNVLTVIANDYYEHFAAALQKDFNESGGFNKNEVTRGILVTVLKNAGTPVDKINADLINALQEELFHNNVTDLKKLLTKNAAKHLETAVFSNPTLKEHSIKIKEAFIDAMERKKSNKITIKNADNPEIENAYQSYVSEGEFQKMLDVLLRDLSKRTIYKTEIDKDSFISDCAENVNGKLRGRRLARRFETHSGKAVYNELQQFTMEQSEKDTQEEVRLTPARTDFEIAEYIMYHTNLPRLAIFKVLERLDNKEVLSDQDCLDETAGVINDTLKEAKSKVITYEVIDGYVFDEKTILALENIDEEMFNEERKVYAAKSGKKKALNKYYIAGSRGEYDFAERLDEDKNVLLFTKLKKGGFVINTPYGEYSPDWAIVYRAPGNGVKLYFVIETKFDKKQENLQGVEKTKIKCAKLHFKTVSEIIKFHWVSSYEDFEKEAGRGTA